MEDVQLDACGVLLPHPAGWFNNVLVSTCMHTWSSHASMYAGTIAMVLLALDA